MKFSEKEIQHYIWENRAHFADLVHYPDWQELYPYNMDGCALWELLYYHTLMLYRRNVVCLRDMVLWGCEVSLPRDNDSSIRADFLGNIGGSNGLVVCELKISKATERQSYTELLAYTNHIRREFAPMSRKDIVYLLIAPMEERIIREATIHTMLYDQHNIVALVPHVGDTLDSLYLEVWVPPMKEFVIHAKTVCHFENIDTFKVCWRGVGVVS